MKREEMEKLIAEVRTFKDAISFVALGGEDLQRLADFAALGACVAEPTEEEIEAMARALYARDAFSLVEADVIIEIEWDDNGRAIKEGPAWRLQENTARLALLALKDRANV